uniref:Cytochrome P450 142 n=1 Tax=Mycobacterium riyadhense TaxID=486698 RepID=A0A653ENU2_9MYCO|nr:Putative cytochrome P450 142 [Mycobacterium riyadhense]
MFDEPFRFDVVRNPNKHLAFGFGVHLWLGAALAHMEVSSSFADTRRTKGLSGPHAGHNDLCLAGGGEMSFVSAVPDYVAAAATDLASIGSTISNASALAAVPTSGAVFPAGADEISAWLAALFAARAQTYQLLSAQAEAFHSQFVQLMSSGAEQYALSEATNNSTLQTAGQGASAIGAPSQALLGGLLTGAAYHGAPATGATTPTAAFRAATAIPTQPASAVVTPGSAGPSAVPVGRAVPMGSTVPAGSVGPTVRPPFQPLVAAESAGRVAAEVGSPAALTPLPAGPAARAAPAGTTSPAGRAEAIQLRAATPSF